MAEELKEENPVATIFYTCECGREIIAELAKTFTITITKVEGTTDNFTAGPV